MTEAMVGDALVEKVARSLTKPQRALLLRGSASDERMATIQSMIDKGLMYLRIDSPDGRHGFIGCELTDAYLPIARARIAAAESRATEEAKPAAQIDMFGAAA